MNLNWRKKLAECKYNRGFLICYSFETLLDNKVFSGFGNLKQATLDIHPSELELIATITQQISQEMNVNENTINVVIISVNQMTLKDFKEFCESQ